MMNPAKVLQVYRTRLRAALSNQRKILYGAEAMDFIVSPKHNGTAIMDGVLAILPKSLMLGESNSDVEVVVNYRTPRWKHLVSVWHEQGAKDTPLSKFLLGPQSRFIFQSNSLALALRFQERGLPTTIIDIRGVDDKGVDMCHVLACDVLQVECTHDYQVLSLRNHTTPSRFNQRKGKAEMDLTQEQLDAIDEIMNRYDCSLQKSVLQYRPRILFQKDLFSACDREEEEMPCSRMVQMIQGVVEDGS
jgi:hypothetical protein